MADYATAPRDRTQTNQVVGTPREFIDAVETRFGKLYCDVCATPSNAKAPIFFQDPKCKEEVFDARVSNRVGFDGLSRPWEIPSAGWWNWLNPPFNDIATWLIKVHKEQLPTLVLVPASVGSNWYAQHVQGKASVFFLSPRMTFEGSTDPYPKDLMLIAFDFTLLGAGLLNTQPVQWRWK